MYVLNITAAKDDRTSQDQRPASTEAEGPQDGTPAMASLQGTVEAEPPLFPTRPIRMKIAVATTATTPSPSLKVLITDPERVLPLARVTLRLTFGAEDSRTRTTTATTDDGIRRSKWR